MLRLLLRSGLVWGAVVAVLGLSLTRIELQADAPPPAITPHPGQHAAVSGAAACGADACMALAVKDAGGAVVCHSDVTDSCAVALGASFTLAIDITIAPSEGYILAQTWLDFGSLLGWKFSENPAEEIVWPDCDPGTAVWGPINPPGPRTFVNHGCLTGLLPPQPVSHYAGNFVEMVFNCTSGESTTEVKLLPAGDPDAGTSGALLTLADEDSTQLVPGVDNLTIECSASVPTPTFTPTPVTPANTPTGGPATTPTHTPTSTPDGPPPTPDGPTNTPTSTPTTPGGSTPGATNTPTRTNTPAPGATPTPTSTPLPDVCAEDAQEQNDSVLAPRAVTLPVSQATLAACPGDPDWYSFTLAAGDQLFVSATFSHEEGNIDLTLYRGSSVQIGSATSATDNEKIVYTAAVGGKYTAGVLLMQDGGAAPGNYYGLRIGIGAPPTPTPAGRVGDVSCDGAVDPIDAAFLLQLAAALIARLPCSNGDANADGIVNVVDATIVLQYSAGMLGTLPPQGFAGRALRAAR